MSKLTTKARDNLKPDDFAVPGKKLLPIHDANHVKAAWRLLPMTKGLTDAEVAEAKRRILARAKKFGIDTSNWKSEKTVSKESISTEGLTFRAALLADVRMLLGD